MDNNKLKKILSQIEDEVSDGVELKESLKKLSEAIINANEEMMATYIEGTRRLLNKQYPDASNEIKRLGNKLDELSREFAKNTAKVETAVKEIRLPASSDFRLPATILKQPIKELTTAINGMAKEEKDDGPMVVKLDPKDLATLSEVKIVAGGGNSGGLVAVNSLGEAKQLTLDDNDYLQVNIKSGTVTATVDTTGLATSANQTTIISHVDGVETLLTTIDADTDAIKTAVETIDNAIAGTEMQVDIVASLPAGTNAIGKLGANSGVDIGDVDVTSIVPGTGATNLGKAEDAAHANGDTGVMLLGVRNDADVALTGTDGDYSAIAITDSGKVNCHVEGWDTHDNVSYAKPLSIGFKAETSLKGITPVADGDATHGYADSDGVQVVKLNTTGADLISERISNTNGTSTAFSNFSAVASTYNYITAISIHNSSATDGYVDFRDGAAGSVLYTVACPAGGGAVISSAIPLFKSSANTAVAYDVSGALSTVYISASGYQSKV